MSTRARTASVKYLYYVCREWPYLRQIIRSLKYRQNVKINILEQGYTFQTNQGRKVESKGNKMEFQTALFIQRQEMCTHVGVGESFCFQMGSGATKGQYEVKYLDKM